MSTPPPAKRLMTSSDVFAPPVGAASTVPAPPPMPMPPAATAAPADAIVPTTPNPRKRRASRTPPSDARKLNVKPPSATQGVAESGGSASVSIPALLSEETVKKKSRTNTPWTAAEEQKLKQMRDSNNTWSEIAKAFPHRTEGSVKKHWYKDMHYAEFAEDETKALLEAIKEYEANKWKVIGAKLGKPAKACEQFAKDHFKTA